VRLRAEKLGITYQRYGKSTWFAPFDRPGELGEFSLNVSGKVVKYGEKNWAPYEDARGGLSFVYSWDPLVLIECDEKQLICTPKHRAGISLPVDTARIIVRGGSQMVRQGNHLYGFVHSRVACRKCPIGFLHSSHFAVVRISTLTLLHVSPAIAVVEWPKYQIMDPVSVIRVDAENDVMDVSASADDSKVLHLRVYGAFELMDRVLAQNASSAAPPFGWDKKVDKDQKLLCTRLWG
jgi:hypothetical protein